MADGNPASHRMTNKHLKEHRASLWAAQQKIKQERNKLNQAAEAKNKALRAEGKPTPWEQAKEQRRLHRVSLQR